MTLRNAILSSLLFAVGCSYPAVHAGTDVDGGTPSVPIVGDDPFGRVVTGTFAFDDDQQGIHETKTISMYLIFPNGRRSGAEVVLTTTPLEDSIGPLNGFIGTLDAQAGAVTEAGVRFCPFDADCRCGFLQGDIVGPDDGVRALVWYLPGCHTSTPANRMLQATGWLRNDGRDLPTGELRLMNSQIGPLSHVRLVSTVPLTVGGYLDLEVTAPATMQVGGGLSWTELIFGPGLTAWPPNEALHVRLHELKDIIGRPIPLDTSLAPLRTTAELHDLDLHVEPPAGALAGAVWDGQKAELRVDGDLWRPRAALISLGTPPGQTLRVRLHQECFSGTDAEAALVTADGTSTAIPLPCANAEADVLVPVPGPGPLWLTVELYPTVRGRTPAQQVVISGLSFEP